jgi:hypothetical protein
MAEDAGSVRVVTHGPSVARIKSSAQARISPKPFGQSSVRGVALASADRLANATMLNFVLKQPHHGQPSGCIKLPLNFEGTVP